MEFRFQLPSKYGRKIVIPKKSFDGQFRYYELENVKSIRIDEDYVLNGRTRPSIIIEYNNRLFTINDFGSFAQFKLACKEIHENRISFALLQEKHYPNKTAFNILDNLEEQGYVCKGLSFVLQNYNLDNLEAFKAEGYYYNDTKNLYLTTEEHQMLAQDLAQTLIKPAILNRYKITHNQFYLWALSKFVGE